MKGDFNLVGAEVSIADKTEIHISMSNDKKSSFQIRANTEDNVKKTFISPFTVVNFIS